MENEHELTVEKPLSAEDDWADKDFQANDIRFLGTGHEKATGCLKNLGGRPPVTDKKVIISMRLKNSDV